MVEKASTCLVTCIGAALVLLFPLSAKNEFTAFLQVFLVKEKHNSDGFADHCPDLKVKGTDRGNYFHKPSGDTSAHMLFCWTMR